MTNQQESERWRALENRDAACDGSFVYGVATTGVYCRPSCSSRKPLRENVAFFDDSSAAERAGFRPCKRCQPSSGEPHSMSAIRVARMCRAIEEADAPLPLAALADLVALSPNRAQKLFKSTVGLSPKAYASAIRDRRLRKELVSTQGSITSAMFAAGFQASSRFYERASSILGMTPKEYRAGADGVEVGFALGECDLGSVLVAGTARGLCSVSLGDDPDALLQDLEGRFTGARKLAPNAKLAAALARVIESIDDPARSAELPLDVRGTAFQHRVWAALTCIPRGHTLSYSEVARALGAPQAHRAVASACAQNPLALLVPCHRVIPQGRGVGGYRWGVDRKRALLLREQSATARTTRY
jgi:AraC family transcriptional regulator of adaptative response/methylated-DNA-[protein]-cysteine methyltransferase